MKAKTGVWIDHGKAIVVTLSDKGDDRVMVISQVSKQLRRSGTRTGRSGEVHQPVPADDLRQRKVTAHLNAYYDTVIMALDGASAILLFGPGEARGELKKRLVKKKMGDRIVAVESADRMTDRQIAAKVHTFFGK